MTTCCKVYARSAHTITDLKRNCHIRLFHELRSFDDVQHGDYIFPTSNAVIQCAATRLSNALSERDKQIIDLQKTIDEYIILLKFSQCYNHFGQTVVLRRLKDGNRDNKQIQGWNFWKNCTQYLSNFNDRDHEQDIVQQQIYAIVLEYGINAATWDAIVKLNKRRNDQVHVPITQADARWLKNNASKYEQFERHPWRSNFVNAVTNLANALCRQNRPDHFAQPHESSLMQYLNSNR